MQVVHTAAVPPNQGRDLARDQRLHYEEQE